MDRAAQGFLPRRERVMAATAPSRESRVSELLRRARYEVLPLAGVEDEVLAHVPSDVRVTVTASPTRGLEPTLALTASLAAHGYTAVPHLSARLVADASELEDVVHRLREAGVGDVFVVAGDATEPRGAFGGAIDLLEALDELGRPFPEVGITGYPESHPFIDDETTIAAMFEKARHATYIVSQICFDSAVTARWIEAVWARGTRLPIYVGLPGAVSRAKLLRVSTRIGIGDSARFLRKNGSLAGRFLRSGFRPDPLIDALGGVLDGEKVAGLHLFTFNDVEDTERWRRMRLERLASAALAATPGS
jgi:methylenetetrahydrofolate reductase (NADPH)